MKRLPLIAFLLLAAASAFAQSPLPNDYRERFTEVHRAYAQNPGDVEVLYNLAQFYFDNSHPLRDLPLAMTYARQAEKEHITLLETNKIKRLTQLGKVGIDLTSLRQLQQAIYEAARNTLSLRNDFTIDEIDAYLEVFGSDKAMARKLRQMRLQRQYDAALADGSADACYAFIALYPGTVEAGQLEERMRELTPTLFRGLDTDAAIDSVVARYPLSPSVAQAAQRLKSRLAYDETRRIGTVEAYRRYLSRYPASDESPQARHSLDALLDDDFARRTTALQLAQFADSNADSPLADRALADMRRLIYENHDVEAARYYVEHFRLDPYCSEVYGRYYSWYSLEGNATLLHLFDDANPDFPYPHALESDLDQAAYADTIDFLRPFREDDYYTYASYVRHLTGRGLALVPLQRMLQPLLARRDYAAALERVQQFDLCFENQWAGRYADLQHILSTPDPEHALRTELTGNGIGSAAVNPADRLLYFTRSGIGGNVVCRRLSSGYDTVRFSNTAATDLVLFGFDADGSRMLLGSGGDIWLAEPDGDAWRISDIPPYPLNTDYIETDAYMLPDGSGMLLASDRPGGYNLQPSGARFHGDTALATDLWFIPYTLQGWGEPVNLGLGINTSYCERSPILSRNFRTLYFISDGYGGLGYGDVMVAERTGAGWTSWSTPRNMGREVNSALRERSVTFSPDERRIYLTSDSCVSSFATSHNTAVSYTSYDLNVMGLERHLISVTVADLDRQAVVQRVGYDGASPSVTLNVQNSARCIVLAEAGALFVPAVYIQNFTRAGALLRGYTFDELVAAARPLTLYAVGFRHDTDELLPVAQLQLDQLARFLQRNPAAVVEFAVHVPGTDARACYTLSLERGQALRAYLADRGIDSTRVLLSPYGNTETGPRGDAFVAVTFRE